MQNSTLKLKSNHWLEFSLLQEKLWINSGLRLIRERVFHTLSTYNFRGPILINNRNGYPFFDNTKQHLSHTHKTQTQFCKPLNLKTLGKQLMLYPQLWLYYTTTTKFFNI